MIIVNDYVNYLRKGQRYTKCIMVREIGGVAMQLNLLKDVASLSQIGVVKLATTDVGWALVELLKASFQEEPCDVVVGLGPQTDVEVASDQSRFAVADQGLKIINQGGNTAVA